MELFCIFNYLNDFLMLFMSLIGSIIILIISPILYLINLKRIVYYKKAKSIIITGAGSGLGREIALNYSKNLNIKLGLIGRDLNKLKKVRDECLKNGAHIVEINSIDVSERDKMEQFINDFDQRYPIDIIYANAAVNELTLPKEYDFNKRCHKIIDINVNGLLNTVLPVIPLFENRKSGQIVMISSVGPLTNFVFPTYCGSKAFVTSFGLTLRNRLSSSGIGVTVVVPGYIETPMAQVLEQKDLLFSVTPSYGASVIIEGVQYNKAMIYFSRKIFLLSYFISLIPPNFAKDSFDFILSKFLSYPDYSKPITTKITSSSKKVK